MGRTVFTRAEAQAKVGRRVRSRVAVAGVRAGAVGTITSADRVSDGSDVEVEWGQVGRRTPWVDWLTKVEYEARLVELPA